jgi:hypothetical protein
VEPGVRDGRLDQGANHRLESMKHIRLDFYAGDGGTHTVRIESIPPHLRNQYQFATATLCLDGSPPTPPPDLSLEFDEEVMGPFGVETLSPSSPGLYVHMYQPYEREKVTDMHRRCLPQFAQFFHQHGETVAGSFAVPALGANWVAEWYSIDVGSYEEMSQKLSQVELPREMQDIVDEGRFLQSASRARCFIWMAPIEPLPDAKAVPTS